MRVKIFKKKGYRTLYPATLIKKIEKKKIWSLLIRLWIVDKVSKN